MKGTNKGTFESIGGLDKNEANQKEAQIAGDLPKVTNVAGQTKNLPGPFFTQPPLWNLG
jgi:hypothetical protein